MKLNIQLFGENYVDTDALRNTAEQLKSLSNAMVDDFESAAADLIAIWTDKGYNSEDIATKFTEIINGCKADFEELRTNLTSLANQLVEIGGSYEQIDAKIASELTAWAETFMNTINKIKGGLNSTTAKGSYSFSSYLTDVSSSTRNIVGEVATIAQNTGNFYTSVTGKTVLQTVEEISNAAIGSIGTLFGATGNSGFTSIATSFVNGMLGLLK